MILVTGATGLSGSHVVQEFARQHAPVRALVRNRDKASTLAALPTVEVVEGDMLRPETLGPAFRGVDRVLMISSSDPLMAETQIAFIDAAKKAGIPYIVKYSGAESGVGFDRQNFRFARMHAEIEKYLEQSGLAWTHLRPSQFMQVYFREIPTIVAKDTLFLPMDNIPIAPVDIEDVAKAAYAILTSTGHESKTYDMTGPQSLTMAQIAEDLSAVLGRTIRYVNVDPAAKKQAMIAAGVPSEFAESLDELFAERRRHPESRVNLSTHDLFGIHPTTFAEFARKNIAAFQGAVAVS